MSLLSPQSIAIIGASETEGKVGHDICKNLLTQGYKGRIYPVNPKHETILNTKCYASVSDIQETVDLAIIVVPAKIVPSIMEECAKASIADIVIISAGFGEVGTAEGDVLEKEVQNIAQKNGLNIVGPNCLGVIRPAIGMNASFAKSIPPKGSIAFISQSGAMAVGMMDSAVETGLGFSFVASIGNKTVLNECDFLEMAANDSETTVIGLYLESISDGKKILSTALKIDKPIVLLKAGVSKKGTAAAASHTGALAGNDAAIDALCTQAGIRRARTTEELFDLLEVLSKEPPLLSNRIAIITNAGGPGILATDAAQIVGLELPALTKGNEQELQKALPTAASTKNPIDVVGDAGVDRYIAALTAVGDDKNIDGVCIVLTPQVMTPCTQIASGIITWKKSHPLMPVVTCFIGQDHVQEERKILQDAGIPSLETPERAVQALAALRIKEKQIPCQTQKNEKRMQEAQDLLQNHKGLLPEKVLQTMCSLYDLPVPIQSIARSADEAVSLANSMGYPVIAKISSPQIVHKTDIGGVRADLQTEEDVRLAYKDIQLNAEKHLSTLPSKASIDGVLIQQFLPAGEEFIVGAIQDDTFGHLIMVGLGGIYTELLQDTAFRIAPIDEKDAYAMLQELIAWDILLGTRGKEQLNIDALVKLLVSVSSMLQECPQITDIDLNPVLVTTKGITVADAKIITE